MTDTLVTTEDLRAAESALVDEAINLCAGSIADALQRNELFKAAEKLATVRWKLKRQTLNQAKQPPPPQQPAPQPVQRAASVPRNGGSLVHRMPFGASKGKAIADPKVPVGELKFMKKWLSEHFDDKPEYRQSNIDLHAAIDAEIRKRGG